MSSDTKTVNNTLYAAVIVGSGFGGLCMGIKLKQAGYTNFLILEKADSLGGTWRENTYPGAECDVGSAFYSYSFAPNPDWDYKWSKQEQILAYLNQCAKVYELNQHLHFNTKVRSATFNESSKTWTITSEAGETFNSRFFIPALGQLHEPNIPLINGFDSYQGVAFHSAQWRHAVDIKNKNIAVIGNAASAVQLIPEIADDVKQLSIYQRSANWILPKGDRPFNRLEKWLAKHTQLLHKWYRLNMWSIGELGLLPAIKGSKLHRKILSWYSIRQMKKHIQDPVLQKSLIPDYPIGAKRILLVDKYYPSLNRDNVELVTEPIDHFTASGIQDESGKTREHDVVVFATGFKTNPFLASIDITGKDSRKLREHWKDGAYAFNGVLTNKFPNLFMLYGPNTNTGHTSVIFMHEVQSDYIIKLMQKAGEGSIEVHAETEKNFAAELQNRLAKMAWNEVQASWYKQGERIPNNWPGSTLEYRKRLKSPDWSDYNICSSNR